MKLTQVSAVFAAVMTAGCAIDTRTLAYDGNRYSYDNDRYAVRADVNRQLNRIDQSLDNRAAPAVEACRVYADNILKPQAQAIRQSGYAARFEDCSLNERGNVETTLMYDIPRDNARLMAKIAGDACYKATDVYHAIEDNQGYRGQRWSGNLVECNIGLDGVRAEFRLPPETTERDITRYPAPSYNRW